MAKKIQREKAGILVELTEVDSDSNWVAGTVGDFMFEAKVYDSGSQFGIKDGRVSKLHIYKRSGKAFPFQYGGDIVQYDRGWGQRPTKEFKPHFDAVMKVLEEVPTRFS